MKNEILENNLEIFDRKIDEYYISCLPSIFYNRKDLPFHAINILNIYKKFSCNLINIEKHNLAYKLVDIKLNYCYLKTTSHLFYKGTTLIVGNDQLEKINPNTISMLRGNHYRVYLISIVIEQILDLLQMIYFDELEDVKKNKWEKLVSKIKTKFCITPEEEQMIIGFKEYRTAEFHKFSKVRGFLSRKLWNHFQNEEQILDKLLLKIWHSCPVALIHLKESKCKNGR